MDEPFELRRRDALNRSHFVAVGGAVGDPNLAAFQAQPVGQEFHDRVVGAPIFGRHGDVDFDGTGRVTHHDVAFSPRRHANGEHRGRLRLRGGAHGTAISLRHDSEFRKRNGVRKCDRLREATQDAAASLALGCEIHYKQRL